jgi:hypothetical protein
MNLQGRDSLPIDSRVGVLPHHSIGNRALLFYSRVGGPAPYWANRPAYEPAGVEENYSHVGEPEGYQTTPLLFYGACYV